MNRFIFGLCSLSILAVTAARAGQGLTVPDDDPLWPRWQTRLSITVDVDRPAALKLTPAVQRAQIMSDYFPQPFSLAPSSSWQGGLRATGGLVVGRPGLFAGAGAAAASPLLAQVDATRLGGESNSSLGSVWPYVGIGYTGLSRASGWGFTADLGFIVRSEGSGLNLGQLAGSSAGLDDKVRTIRFAPTLQLGVRYAF